MPDAEHNERMDCPEGLEWGLNRCKSAGARRWLIEVCGEHAEQREINLKMARIKWILARLGNDSKPAEGKI